MPPRAAPAPHITAPVPVQHARLRRRLAREDDASERGDKVGEGYALRIAAFRLGRLGADWDSGATDLSVA